MRLLLSLSMLWLFGSCSLSASLPVWIDTDPSVARGGHEVDDGFALIQAFHSPSLAVRGVSVVFGNAPLDQAVPIGQRLVSDFGPKGMQVYQGAASPQQMGQETEATLALAAALRREELTIVAIGPVTNIATVLLNHPELTRRIKTIVAVAGRRPHQRFSLSPSAPAFRDFNFESDAPAFQVLLDAGVPLVLTPWEISSKVWMHKDDLQHLRAANASLGWVLDAADDWLTFWREKLGANGFNPFDTLAVGYVISSAGFGCERLPVAIRQMPDDTVSRASKPPDKPFLLVDKNIRSKSSLLYCFEPPTHFSETLLALLAKHD